MTTFKDFKETRKANKEQAKARVQRVRESASKLLSIYVESLELPSEFWKDTGGSEYPYVYIQDANPRGSNGVKCKPTELTVDPVKGTDFILFTLTDDEPGNAQYERLHVNINGIQDDINISVNGELVESSNFVNFDEKYHKVCEFLKDSILKAINGEYFTGSQKESLKLWD